MIEFDKINEVAKLYAETIDKSSLAQSKMEKDFKKMYDMYIKQFLQKNIPNHIIPINPVV